MNHPNDHLDADLQPLAGDLDQLAGLERRAASPALEDRITRATASIIGPVPVIAKIHEPAARVVEVRRTSWRIWTARAAAVLAVAIGGYIAVFTLKGKAPAKPDSSVDSFMAALDAVDSIATAAGDVTDLAAKLGIVTTTAAEELTGADLQEGS